MLRLLTGAARSRHQLREALLRKGIEESVAESVLDRFDEVGLVDDAEYARMLVRSQHESRGLARRALSMELRRRGIGDDDAESALADLDAESEERAARALVEKRWRATAGLPVEVRVRRVSGALARKGHAPSVIARLIREQRDHDESIDVDLHGSPAEPWEDSLADPE